MLRSQLPFDLLASLELGTRPLESSIYTPSYLHGYVSTHRTQGYYPGFAHLGKSQLPKLQLMAGAVAHGRCLYHLEHPSSILSPAPF